ncbi:hypothetical protein T4D_2661 [Trichinella pseudospiralis]|uniref:Uncharacterized protein n=1 Tax=Trichinella pseudospiralis TaxID=6337 RepID=A0A0V1G3Q4_TRIPS|nr:hypothetical protein T4D_2661 [Trichinella pseudospiralis]
MKTWQMSPATSNKYKLFQCLFPDFKLKYYQTLLLERIFNQEALMILSLVLSFMNSMRVNRVEKEEQ